MVGGLMKYKEVIYMAIKKVQIVPPGYTDILHPETDSTVVLMSDGSTLENKMKIGRAHV